METFSDYKRKISIMQVAEDLGYRVDRSKGRVSPVLKLFDSNGVKVDEIVVRNPHDNSTQHYFDRSYQGGDLIAFIKNHIDNFPQFQHSNLFVRLNMILAHYAKSPLQPQDSPRVLKTKFNRERYQTIPTSIEDLTYLTKERNIGISTVEKFLPFIERIKDTELKGNFYNIAFPYTVPGSEEILNYELRNFGFKGMAAGGNKTNSLWIADFSGDPLLAKHLYFAESALDAMSFFQLYKHKINLEESVFLSVGGYPSNSQISNVLKHFPNALAHTCFDNDLNGRLYDIKVHALIASKEPKILLKKEDILFKLDNKEFSIPKEELSIERYRKEAKQVAPLRVHKPPHGFKDFNEVLIKNKNQQKVSL